jgi:hypothetical protein
MERIQFLETYRPLNNLEMVNEQHMEFVEEIMLHQQDS